MWKKMKNPQILDNKVEGREWWQWSSSERTRYRPGHLQHASYWNFSFMNSSYIHASILLSAPSLSCSYYWHTHRLVWCSSMKRKLAAFSSRSSHSSLGDFHPEKNPFSVVNPVNSCKNKQDVLLLQVKIQLP